MHLVMFVVAVVAARLPVVVAEKQELVEEQAVAEDIALAVEVY